MNTLINLSLQPVFIIMDSSGDPRLSNSLLFQQAKPGPLSSTLSLPLHKCRTGIRENTGTTTPIKNVNRTV